MGKLVASDEMYRNLDAGIGKAIQAVDDFSRNPLFRSSELYDNLNGTSLQLRDAMRDFKANAKNYLMFKIF